MNNLCDTIEIRQCVAVRFNIWFLHQDWHIMYCDRPFWRRPGKPVFVLALLFLSFVDLSVKSVFKFHLLLFLVPPSLRSSSIRLYPSATNKFFFHIPTQLKAFSESKLLFKMFHRSNCFQLYHKIWKVVLKPNIDKFGKHSQTLPLIIFCTSVHLF